MNTIKASRIYSDLRWKEKLSGWIKYYPWKTLLLVPDSLLPKNIRAIKRFYVVLRKFDDICDGDDELWFQTNISSLVINTLVNAVLNWEKCKYEDELLQYLYHTYIELYWLGWEVLLEEFRKISILCAETLFYDKTRIEAHINCETIYPSNREIELYIDDMELKWVFKGLLLLLWWEGEIKEFRDLIHATRRYYYFSRDIEEDTEDGLINYTDLDSSIESVQKDMKESGKRILDGFLSGENPLKDLGLVDRLIIDKIYLKSAKKYFNSN